jgi:hypothetical protein
MLTKGCPEQVTLLQYNPPYTIPTVRRNEVDPSISLNPHESVFLFG